MKNIIAIGGLICVMFVGNIDADEGFNTPREIGSVTTEFNGGRVLGKKYNLYNYVGGTFVGSIYITNNGRNSSSTSRNSITDYSDTKEMVRILDDAFVNWCKITNTSFNSPYLNIWAKALYFYPSIGYSQISISKY